MGAYTREECDRIVSGVVRSKPFAYLGWMLRVPQEEAKALADKARYDVYADEWLNMLLGATWWHWKKAVSLG